LHGLILVVEDERLVANGLSQQIRAVGWQVRVTATVQASLSVLDEPIDGAIVDLGLPDGSGFEVIEAARSRQRSVPVLILTSEHNTANINRAQRLGTEYACKPAEPENLLSFLDRCRASRKEDVGHGRMESSSRVRASCEHETRDEASNGTTSTGALEAFLVVYEKSKSADLLAFYEMARAAASIERDGLLAAATASTGLCARTLRSYVLVGRFIRPDELSEISDLRDEAGAALTRKSLIQLAGIPRARRSRILQRLTSICS
jgi:DNA-binding NarL/FixJ family response regulator